MSCRESRRAQYEKLFNSYEDEIAKLTNINERDILCMTVENHYYYNHFIMTSNISRLQQLTAKELNDSKDQVSMLQNTIKALQQENETLRQEIGKKSPVTTTHIF